ncbi:AhpC/TSA family protein [Paenibacillus sp. sptzw28]|uniref:peroxiredoxin-like family protein n=1 Tax=Paenibacillus sp. sptzw28 TaxID=715179 RepID=UPI001C6F357A|nr:peroxiredoxin-like family protein [Paenibacillus sp. sptzw28]QYR19314.1 AhpC/TSA family protein [Paenibacillus sp. sptzw28]
MEGLQYPKLQDELAAVTKHGLEALPKEVIAAFERSISELRESGTAKGLTVGVQAPDFMLANQEGNNISLSEEIAKGPVILTFYRGDWCPFCNLEIKAYQRIMDSIHAAGAQLLAISPLTPDNSLADQQKNELNFHVLSDIGNRVAKKYNLKFKLPDNLHQIYSSLGFALDKFNGDDSWELPVPATYIIDKQGMISAASVNPDYRTRMEPAEVLNILRSL